MLHIGEIQTLLNTAYGDPQKAQARIGRQYYHARHAIQNYRLFYYDAHGELQEDKTRSNIKISHPFFTELADQEVQYLLSNRDRIVVPKMNSCKRKWTVTSMKTTAFGQNWQMPVQMLWSAAVAGCMPI